MYNSPFHNMDSKNVFPFKSFGAYYLPDMVIQREFRRTAYSLSNGVPLFFSGYDEREQICSVHPLWNFQCLVRISASIRALVIPGPWKSRNFLFVEPGNTCNPRRPKQSSFPRPSFTLKLIGPHLLSIDQVASPASTLLFFFQTIFARSRSKHETFHGKLSF